MKFLDDNSDVSEIDASIKNSWKWEWIERKDVNNDCMRLWCKKVNIPGQAFCTWCSSNLKYGSEGAKALLTHSKTTTHVKHAKSVKKTVSLGHFMLSNENINDGDRHLDINTRKTRQEAILSSFIAENSLSFSLCPKLIELAQVLGRDSTALQQVQMNRTTLSYKLKYGLAKTIKDKVICALRDTYFSLNIDESTNNAEASILAILVQFYCEKENKVILQHLASLKLENCSALSIYLSIVELIESNNIPWTNLVSILMDSCNAMRGKKSGVETRLRENKVPHLLDIDGDTCHTANNSAKKFTSFFSSYLENLCDDIYYDMKSTSKKEIFFKICSCLSMKNMKPLRRPEHRWIYLLVVLERIKMLWDALIVFYFHYIPKVDKFVYQNIVDEVYKKKKISTSKKKTIENLHSKLQSQKLTQDGLNRKNRIVNGLFVNRNKTLMQISLFSSVLPQFDKYIKFFENKKPMFHLLHVHLYKLLREFLGLFLKPEVLNECLTYKDLLQLNFDNLENLLPDNLIFSGSEALVIMNKLKKKHPIVIEFRKTLKKAYLATGKYMVQKLPLGNKTLINLSCLDPNLRGKTSSISAFSNLASLIPHLLTEAERKTYDMEIRKYQNDIELTDCNTNTGDSLDAYWKKVFEMKEDENFKYPSLTKLVKAYLSIFHSAVVESTFNFMDTIVTDYRTSLAIESLDAVQTIKFDLLSTNSTTFEKYGSSNPISDPLDKEILHNLRNSWTFYQEELKKKQLNIKNISLKEDECERSKVQKQEISSKGNSPVPDETLKNSSSEPSCSAYQSENDSLKKKKEISSKGNSPVPGGTLKNSSSEPSCSAYQSENDSLKNEKLDISTFTYASKKKKKISSKGNSPVHDETFKNNSSELSCSAHQSENDSLKKRKLDIPTSTYAPKKKKTLKDFFK